MARCKAAFPSRKRQAPGDGARQESCAASMNTLDARISTDLVTVFMALFMQRAVGSVFRTN